MGFLSDYFAGLIDEVMVWTEVRTPDEICADAHGTWDGFSCSFSEPVGTLEDPDNPVTLNNAATCMFFLDEWADAYRFLECSLYLEPQNGSAIANMANYEYTYEGNLEAALDLYERAKAADPQNPEWAYQAMQVALELGDTDTASDMLADLPAPSGASNGYRGVGTGDGSSTGSFCCPCDPPTTYSNISDCTAACSATVSCFVGICAFNADCGGDPGLPLSFGIKLCYPPSGAQICITMDTSGNVGFLVGVSVLNGFLGVGTGFSYNVINQHVNFVVDVGTNTLPINTGATYTYDITADTGQAAVGLSNSSNTSAGQVTVLTH